jgi:(p)ppGpp synthase/HD superfamily hydrolase
MTYLNTHDVLILATNAHLGQFREGGEPYITHPIAVADIALKIAKANDYKQPILDIVYQIALLHDVLEDTPIISKDLLLMMVNPSVVHALYYLNKNNYADYTEMIMGLVSSDLASIVKYADLTHNSSDLKKSSRLDKYTLAKAYIEISRPRLKFNV